MPHGAGRKNCANAQGRLALGFLASRPPSRDPSILGLKTAARMPLDCPEEPRSWRPGSSSDGKTHIWTTRRRSLQLTSS